jgi:uncharacterized protein YycO
MKISLFVLFFYSLLGQAQTFQEGDIIFQTSQGSLSEAIQIATDSRYSHVGIIFRQGNQLMVLEAIQPVQITPLQTWIARGKDGKYFVKRLKEANKVLTANMLEKMRQIGKQYVGKNYDIYFEWTNERLYCSELVWKIYKEATGLEIGQLKPLKAFDLTSDAVKKKLKEHYGHKIPLEEKIISPDAMFQSDLLETVIVQ